MPEKLRPAGESTDDQQKPVELPADLIKRVSVGDTVNGSLSAPLIFYPSGLDVRFFS
ncbi:MAG: hypothetical protein P1V21_10120 [Rhizobiaceae bacterium]|nr:hypothetical protein [Rhizobiaceae bacterium]